MTVPDGNPNEKLHDWDDEELIEYYEELTDVVRYGDPESVTARDKRDFDRMKIELLSRIARKVLLEDKENAE